MLLKIKTTFSVNYSFHRIQEWCLIVTSAGPATYAAYSLLFCTTTLIRNFNLLALCLMSCVTRTWSKLLKFQRFYFRSFCKSCRITKKLSCLLRVIIVFVLGFHVQIQDCGRTSGARTTNHMIIPSLIAKHFPSIHIYLTAYGLGARSMHTSSEQNQTFTIPPDYLRSEHLIWVRIPSWAWWNFGFGIGHNLHLPQKSAASIVLVRQGWQPEGYGSDGSK